MENKKTNVNNGKISFETEQGTFTVEGTEDFVKGAMKEILSKINGTSKQAKKVRKTANKGKGKERTKKNKKLYQPNYIPDLFPKSQIAELKEFFEEKGPKSHQDSYVCAAYWLKKEHNIDELGADEVYTIYRTLNKRIPKYINQVFRDAKTARHFFGISENKDLHYFITPLGEQYVELDLPTDKKEGESGQK